MGSVVAVLGLVLGNSQAMRTAWIEDMLGLIPAVAYLIASSLERKGPSKAFPFGLYRAFSIAYLISATAILLVGGFVLFESVTKLIQQEHPSVGLMSIFGYDVWAGWLMIAALVYSVIPPIILGRLKMPIAHRLHDKVLIADAAMQKADWLTGLAAIGGIVGIGFGLWWADALAAMLISLDVVADGGRHVWRAMRDLADQQPHTADRAELHPAIEASREAALSVPGVADAEVELREEGHLMTGTIYITPAADANLLTVLQDVRSAVEASDWRIYEPVIAPVIRI
jgi:cation diffusion facilitator family transporter